MEQRRKREREIFLGASRTDKREVDKYCEDVPHAENTGSCGGTAA
jgi:hypothetical protein